VRQELGSNGAQMARQHYMTHGYKEGRVYRRLHVLLRYSTCGSVMHQHYAHISGMALAAALGADAMLPPSLLESQGTQAKARRPSAFATIWDTDHVTR
jgi:hypothetical protein